MRSLALNSDAGGDTMSAWSDVVTHPDQSRGNIGLMLQP